MTGPIHNAILGVRKVLASLVFRRTADLRALERARERLQVQETLLAESRATLEKVQRIAGMGSWQWNVADGTQVWSDELYRIFGYSPGAFEPTYERFTNAICVEDREKAVGVIREALATGAAYSHEYRIVRPDGEMRYVRSQGEPAHGEGADCRLAIGVVLDISERKRAEAEARIKNQRFYAFMSNCPTAAFIRDSRNRLVYANPAFTRSVGLLEEREWLNTTPEEIWGETVGRRIAEENRRVLATGEPEMCEQDLVHPDGSHHAWIANKFILEDPSGERFLAVMALEVTEQKQREEELRKLSLAVEQNPVSVIITDLEGRMEYVNQKCVDVTGYERHELIGENPRVLKSGDKTPEDYKAIWQTISSGHTWRGEFHNVRKNGERYWEEALISPVRNDKGEITHFLAIKEDITEVKQARKALEQSEAFAMTLLESSIIGAAIIRADGTFVYVNQRLAEMVGMTVEELLASNASDMYVDPEDRILLLERLRAEGRQQEVEVRLKEAGGKEFSALLSLEATMHNGEPVKYCSVYDITHRLAAEEALRQSEKLKGSILDDAMDAIVTIDEYGNVLEYNKSAETLFGYPKEDVIGQDIADLIIPEAFRDHHRSSLARFRETGTSVILGNRLELVGLCADGREIPIELSLTHVADYHRFTAFIRDLSGRREIEEALRRTQKMEAVGQLTGGIAHDFNNLLGIVLGNLEILRRKTTTDERQIKFVDSAIKAAHRGEALTRKLLAFARQDPRNAEPTEVNQVVVGVLDLIQKSLTRSVAIDTHLDDDLWLVDIDPGDLEDVLVNLAINARDAMPEGGTVIIETRNVELDEDYCKLNPDTHPGAYVLLAVGDTGTGMSPLVLQRIFDPFFTTKEKGKGTGLGMSMVFGFVKRSRGHIKVYSESGHGTTINIYLPKSGASAPKKTDVNEAGGELPGGDETVLVVDDEVDLASVTANRLAQLGYSVKTANSATEALQVIEENPGIALVLTDVVMPGKLDGYGLAKEVARRWPNIAILLMSGYTAYKEKVQMETDEAAVKWIENLLNKPVNITQLANAIRDGLDHCTAVGEGTGRDTR